MSRAPLPEPASLHGLNDLVLALRSSRRFIDVLEIAADQALASLGADSLSLSEWDRDLGRLVTRVNAGTLSAGEVRFPEDEVYSLAREAIVLLEGSGFLVQADDPDAPEPDRTILRGAGMASGLTMPIPSEGRLWGEMWATRAGAHPAYGPQDLAFASEVASLIGEVISSGEWLERTARMAYEDPLTRLGNRRVFDDRLAELLEPGGAGATVVLCDLDDLKAINDRYGHDAGDRVIILAGDALSVVASRADGCVAARIGGDEFALVLPGDARAQAVALAQRAVALLARGPEAATMSCGVAAAASGTEPRALFVTADAALYGAKHRGAQLLLASDLDNSSHEVLRDRPRQPAPPERRRWDDATDRPYAADAAAAVADAVQAMAERMGEVPPDLPGALRWIGDTLLAPLDLDRWVLSFVREPRHLHEAADDATVDGEPVSFVLDSLGLRRARLNADPAPVEEADIATETRPLDQFPAAAAAVRHGAVFGFELVDGATEVPSESGVALLERLGMRFVVGTGAHDGERGWLLTVYGATDHLPLSAVREVMALARASAIREDASHE